MTGHHHPHSHSRGRHNNFSSKTVRRRHTINRIMKAVVTLIALGVIALVCWLYNN